MATDIDEPTYESTDTVASATPETQPESTEAQKALVRKIQKTVKGNYPQTICKLTARGRKAFENYVEDIKKYLHL